MKYIYPLWVCLLFILLAPTTTVVAQTVDYSFSSSSRTWSGTMSSEGMYNGKNVYAHPTASEEVAVYWNDGWTLQYVNFDVGLVAVIATTSEDVGNDPPEFASNKWLNGSGYTLTKLSGSGTVVFTVPLTASITGQTNVSCHAGSNGSLTVSIGGGSANYNYSWSNGTSVSNTSSQANTISGLVSGTYTVTVTDSDGGNVSASATLTEPTAMQLASVIGDINCGGGTDGSIDLSVTGGTPSYTYQWSNGANTQDITGLAAGTYTVTVTDANGCTGMHTATVNQPQPIVVGGQVDANVSCNGASDGAVTASATGGTTPYTYVWSNSATTASMTGLEAGTYSVTATDANGCSTTGEVTITEPTALVATATGDANVSCFDGTDGAASATATGGATPYTYLWSNAATTASMTGLLAGTYSVTVTDANGCTASDAVTINQPTALAAAITLDADVTCHGGNNGALTAFATGGTKDYTFQWSTGSETPVITDLAAGRYTVTVTDANGCAKTASATVTQPDELKGTITVDATVSCYGESDGGLTVAATGGVGSYAYFWSDEAGSTTPGITGLPGGAYTVRIVDENGCTAIAFGAVAEPDTLMIGFATVKDSGAGDGSANALVTGGSEPYLYAWDTLPVVTTQMLSGLVPGSYTVTVTDRNGCVAIDSATVTAAAPGEFCELAIGIDSLLGGPAESIRNLKSIDNSDFASIRLGPGALAGCLENNDSLFHPIFYRFTGDGNTYRIWSATDDGDTALPDGDTRGILVAGNCDSAVPILCSDDESEDALNLMLEFQTEAGMEYLLLVDGGSETATGEYQLRAARVSTTSVAEATIREAAVYPNPTAGKFRVDGVDVQTVKVFDGYGRQVSEQTGRGAEVDIQNLPAGIYTLRILDRQQATYTARVVKQ